MRDNPWTDDRVDLLRRLWAAGETAQAIGAALGGLSRSAVLGKVFRLRLGTAAAANPVSGNGDVAPALPFAAPGRRRRYGARADTTGIVPARGKTLLDLTNECCRWPFGRPGSARFHFCGELGADLQRGMPYCPQHARRAYQSRAGAANETAPLVAVRGTYHLVATQSDPPSPAASRRMTRPDELRRVRR